jgi:sigma-B regulation protein RsbU (phosphoserine phosphatase)
MILRLRVEPPGAAPIDREFNVEELVIGRSPTVGLVVADTSASRQHARLAWRDKLWWLEDLGATNRTRINGIPLLGPTSLHPDDVFLIGDTPIRFVAAPGTDITVGPTDDTVDDRQAARLRTLNEIHRALAEPISLPALLDLILERCFDVLKPEQGVILLKSADGSLTRAATRTHRDDDAEVVVPRRIIDEVAGKARPALVLDAAIDERFSGSESMMMSGIKSFVAAPLVDAEGTLGLITLASRASVRRFSEQDLDLLVSLAGAAALRVRNVGLMEEAAARKVFEHELAIAHEMQMAMLPRTVPERPEISVAATLEPARSVGGDLYDFVLAGDELWFIVADVAGKSVAAALYMAVAKTLFRATVEAGARVGEVVARMNRELARDNERMIFVTALVGCVAVATGDVTLVDAGHNPPVVIDPAGIAAEPPLTKCIALGVVDDAVFAESHVRLAAGSTLVIYTDGATDARNTGGEMFGAERLAAAIAAAGASTPDMLVHHVAATVGAFAAGAPPEDDLTLLAVHYRGGR